MMGVLVRFGMLRHWASCLGILAWFGHLPGRAANVAEDVPSPAGLASWCNPIKDVFMQH